MPWLQVFTSACKSAAVFPVDGVPVVFPWSLKRVDFARCGPLALFSVTLGAVCFSALLACVSMPKVGHTRKACALNRSMAFLWLVVTCFCLFPSKSRWFLRVQQTSLAKAFLALLFLIRCDVSRFTGAHNGARAPVVGRRLVYSVRHVSLLSGLHCLHKPQTGRKYMPQNRRKTRVLWLACVLVLPHTHGKAVVKVRSCALPRL